MSARDSLDRKNVPLRTDPKVSYIDPKARQRRMSDLDDYGSFDEKTNPQQTPEPVVYPKLSYSGFKRKKPLRFMKTRDISFYFERETYLKAFLNEMLIFVGFLITLTILTNASTASIEYFYSKVITGLFIKKQFVISEGQRLTFSDITVLDMIWPYVDVVLLDNFYHKYWYHGNNTKGELANDDANILYENKLIGLPRMRQVRVRNNSCVIPDMFKHLFSVCYAEYSGDSEDQSPYGHGNTSAWQYTSAEVLGSHQFSGIISSYGGGGYFMDFNVTRDISYYTLNILKKNMWLDRASRLVIIDFALYNANINYFCFVQIVFELLPTGAVLPSYDLEILRFHRHINYWDYILLVFQTIFVAYVVYYIWEETYEIIYFRWHYFKSFWNWIDLILILLSCTCIPLYAYLYLYTQNNLLKLIQTDDSHPIFDTLLLVKAMYDDTLDLLLLLCWFKLLKYLSLNQSMYQMQTTLARASTDILSYSVIFFTVFIAFAQLGHLLFGAEVRDFRTVPKSVFALLRTIVGDFNYQAIEHAHHILGPLYFFAFIFFIFFILVNMFLAIIIDTYSQVSNELNAAGAQLQVDDIIGRWMNNLLRKIGCTKLAASRELRADEEFARATYQDIRNLLHKCGFSELEIDLFFAKYEITEDKLISPDDIRHLLSNLENLPASVQQDTRPPPAEIDSETEEFTKRVEILEDAVLAANTKIDIILNKVDDMMETKMGRKTQSGRPE